MKKTVAICDECKENVAIFKCSNCGSDICKNHRYGRFIDIRKEENECKSFQLMVHSINSSNNYSEYPIICKECSEKIKNQFKIIRDMFDKGDQKTYLGIEKELVDELLAIIEKYAKILAI